MADMNMNMNDKSNISGWIWAAVIGIVVMVILLIAAGTTNMEQINQGGLLESDNQPPLVMPSATNNNYNQMIENQPDKLVIIQGDEYIPHTINIRTGEQIAWQNLDNVNHTVSGFGIDVELEPGKSFTHTFNQAGLYNYKCSFHNMEGTVIVENG